MAPNEQQSSPVPEIPALVSAPMVKMIKLWAPGNPSEFTSAECRASKRAETGGEIGRRGVEVEVSMTGQEKHKVLT